MSPDYKALCEQLMELAEGKRYDGSAVIAKARAALAQPEPVAPTDEELTLAYDYAVSAAVGNWREPYKPQDAEAAQLAGLRAVLARWGTPAIEPVAPTDEEIMELIYAMSGHALDSDDFTPEDVYSIRNKIHALFDYND
jgi:hypothetical protein